MWLQKLLVSTDVTCNMALLLGPFTAGWKVREVGEKSREGVREKGEEVREKGEGVGTILLILL